VRVPKLRTLLSVQIRLIPRTIPGHIRRHTRSYYIRRARMPYNRLSPVNPYPKTPSCILDTYLPRTYRIPTLSFRFSPRGGCRLTLPVFTFAIAISLQISKVKLARCGHWGMFIKYNVNLCLAPCPIKNFLRNRKVTVICFKHQVPTLPPSP